MTGSILVFAAEIAPERLNKVKRCSLPLSNLKLKLYLESKYVFFRLVPVKQIGRHVSLMTVKSLLQTSLVRCVGFN